MELLWDYRVVLDLFLGGVGIGAFLFATILFLLDSVKYENIIKKSWILAPFLIIIGLILLLTELGKPFNIIKALTNINMTSVMSIGMFLQLICVVLMLILVIKLLSSKVAELSKCLVYLTAAFSGLIGIYHGFLLTGMGKIVWTDSIPSIFFISSILAGSSLVILISLKDKAFIEFSKNLKLPLTFNLILTMQFIAIFSWVYSLAIRGSETKLAYNELMSSFGSEFWLLMFIGIIIPLIIFSMMLIKKVETKAMFTIATVCIITGSFIVKHIVVYLGQMV